MELNKIYNIDCMEYMATVPNKHFELAIVDPPYAVGASDGNFGRHGTYRKELKHYANHNLTPDKNYFEELFRISKNQIIWGMNYYPQYLYHSGAIVWLKKDVNPLSDCEIAFQSINKLVKIIKIKWFGFTKEGSLPEEKITIHPNQKPVALYRWLLMNYAKKGDKIFDSHMGSGSLVIACIEEGFEYVACELDKDYYEAANKRIEEYKLQGKLF